MHGRYSRAEIEAAFGVLTADDPWIHPEGVLAHQPSTTDLLFITLRLPGRRPACRRHESEALVSPSTRHSGLALGPSLFHRESHEGERPMAIRWRLAREIPTAWMPVMALAV